MSVIEGCSRSEAATASPLRAIVVVSAGREFSSMTTSETPTAISAAIAYATRTPPRTNAREWRAAQRHTSTSSFAVRMTNAGNAGTSSRAETGRATKWLKLSHEVVEQQDDRGPEHEIRAFAESPETVQSPPRP